MSTPWGTEYPQGGTQDERADGRKHAILRNENDDNADDSNENNEDDETTENDKNHANGNQSCKRALKNQYS
jgi:hypothetical protein